MLDEATSAVREAVLGIFSRAGFSGTWALTDMAVSVTRAEDRVAAAAALEEAAMAAVVEDIVDEKTTDILRSTTGELAGLGGIPVTRVAGRHRATPATDVKGPWSTLIVVAMIIVVVAGAAVVGSASGGIARARRGGGDPRTRSAEDSIGSVTHRP